jgi:hypothetical protein
MAVTRGAVRIATRFCSLLVPIVLATALPAVAVAAPIVRDWATSASPFVRVHSNNARVRVRAAAPDSVKLLFKHVVKGKGWRYEEYGPQVAIESRGDTIDISAATGGGRVMVDAFAERFEIDLQVPAHATVELATGDGDVTIRDLAGPVHVKTWDGSVRMQGTRGDVVVSTRGGRLLARGVECSLEAETAGGAMDLSGRFGRLDLGSGAGAMQVAIQPGTHPAAAWTLATTSGSLALALPRDLAAALDARTESGRLWCTLALPADAARDARSVSGALAEGVTPLRVRTASGALRLSTAR